MQLDLAEDVQKSTLLRPAPRPTWAYVAIGPKLLNYNLDSESGALTAGGEITLPSRIQYIAAHPHLPLLYAGCANRAKDEERFELCILSRDDHGNLAFACPPVPLVSRPIQLTIDSVGGHIVIAYNAKPGLSVHRLDRNGMIGQEIPRSEDFDMGISPHQVRVCPADSRAILVARGAKGWGKDKHRQGGLLTVRYDRGVLENDYDFTPDTNQCPGGFNPRNVEFHPTLPLAYVTLEEQGALAVFAMQGDQIQQDVLHLETTLIDPDNVFPKQDCGTLKIHPNGRHIYVANRNDGYVGDQGGRPTWISPDPVPLFNGGENNIAIFDLDETGKPTPRGHIDCGGLHPRTISLDPSGRFLIAGNIAPALFERDGVQVSVPANVTIFKVTDDGGLELIRTMPMDVGAEMVWWSGFIA